MTKVEKTPEQKEISKLTKQIKNLEAELTNVRSLLNNTNSTLRTRGELMDNQNETILNLTRENKSKKETEDKLRLAHEKIGQLIMGHQ